MVEDSRFNKVHTDPRFLKPKASKNKVVLDERFAGLLESQKDKKKVDKFGRKKSKNDDASDLKRFYKLDESVDRARGGGLEESSDEESEGSEDEDSDDSDSDGSVQLGGRARSASIDLSETEAPQFQDNDSDEEEQEATARFALVNMDWDHLRATDLYRVLASALSAVAPPPEKPVKLNKLVDDEGEALPGVGKLKVAKGRLISLVIYQSQFGRERIAREEIEGPPVEVFKQIDEDASGKKKKKRAGAGSDDEQFTAADLIKEQVEDGDEYDSEALRKYQLERLRYYFAIATFDSAKTAEHVYSQIHGTEFERTANFFDLQYVPDETTFDDDPVHDEATEASVAAEGSNYESIEFVTDALRHSKVKLTWDADDPHRKSKISNYLATVSAGGKAGKEMDDDELKQFIASSSDEESEASDEDQDEFFETSGDGKKNKKDDKRKLLRGLLGLGDEPDDRAPSSDDEHEWDGSTKKKSEKEMEITFVPALSEKNKLIDGEEETTIEKYKRKELERKERKKAMKKGLEGPENGAKDTGAGGFDDDFFNNDDGVDPFEDHDAQNSKKKLNKRERRELKKKREEESKKGQAELELLIDEDDEGEELGEDTGKHFDLRKIIKQEKQKSKGKKGKKVVNVEDAFKMDVDDVRFKALHEDHEFAIDPSNPKFVKTKAMDALLTEGRKRREKNRDARAPVGSKPVKNEVKQGDDLSRLVESVKRKATDVGGRGKRSKI